MIIPLGKTTWNRKVYWNLNQIPHCKIGGVTGSGKSKTMEYLCYFMSANAKPEDLSIIIIDLKGGATFAHFANVPHVLGLYADIDETEKALEIVHDLMNERLKKIRMARSAFLAIPSFSRVIVIIDEGGELSPALGVDKEDIAQRKRIFKHMSSIARIGREPRVHLIVGTQRPSDETLPVSIRGQLEATICFRCENELDSNIILRHAGAEKLKKIPGRGIYKNPNGEWEFQAFYVEDETLKKYLQKYKGKLEDSSVPMSSLSSLEFTEEIEEEC